MVARVGQPQGSWDLPLLLLLGKEADYGYGLMKRLSAAGFDEIPGGSLYPALTRLEGAGLLFATWQPADSGPRRKIYSLSPAGVGHLKQSVTAWVKVSRAMDCLVDAYGIERTSSAVDLRTDPDLGG